MDEPLAALDAARKAEILPYIERLRDEVRLPILYVSHSVPEVARLATTVVALTEGRVVRVGAAADVLADPESWPLMGRQEAGAILPARVVGEDPADGLTELAISGGRLWVPRVNAAPGTTLRVHSRARDMILADHRTEGQSTQNYLPATDTQVGPGESPIVDVRLGCGEDRLIARITRRSLRSLALTAGASCWVVFKSVAVARRDIGSFEGRDA
jgi:molybdate transport system ATP-binding protein